ncbi:hypothetical protein V3C99_000870 [Haemonchus contortus]
MHQCKLQLCVELVSSSLTFLLSCYVISSRCCILLMPKISFHPNTSYFIIIIGPIALGRCSMVFGVY